MKNVEMTVEGDELTIKVDLGQNFGDSKSGKTVIVATTAGNAKVPDTDDVLIGLNVFKKK